MAGLPHPGRLPAKRGEKERPRRIFVVIGAAVAMGTALSAPAFDLAELRWQSRALLIFAPSEAEPALAARRAELALAAPAIRDRQMALIEILGVESATLDGDPLPGGTASELRHRYQVPTDVLTLILIGKDGGEKLRAEGPWDLDQVFGLIDRMPMRRQERRERTEALPRRRRISNPHNPSPRATSNLSSWKQVRSENERNY